jgi:hypothetical protein
MLNTDFATNPFSADHLATDETSFPQAAMYRTSGRCAAAAEAET